MRSAPFDLTIVVYPYNTDEEIEVETTWNVSQNGDLELAEVAPDIETLTNSHQVKDVEQTLYDKAYDKLPDWLDQMKVRE